MCEGGSPGPWVRVVGPGEKVSWGATEEARLEWSESGRSGSAETPKGHRG